MRPFLVVEDEVVRESPVELGYGFVAFEVEVFVFEGAPEAFNEDVVQGTAASVHADEDAFALEATGEPGRGKLGALIGVEDVGLGRAQGLVERVQAEIHLQRIGEPPGQHISAKPVHHGHQIHKTL